MCRRIIIIFCLFLASCTPAEKEAPFTIAFGSCGHQDNPLTIFNNIAALQPDLFVFLGDNIYGDTKEMDTLKAKYKKLSDKPSFQNLKKNTTIIGTWDDHDFGWNDSGRHYQFKEESKEIFLDFFEEPLDSERRNHKGIYHAYEYKHQGKIIQVILLDGRTFRDSLLDYAGEYKDDRRFFYEPDYFPHPIDSDKTLLGAAQWEWLEKELQKPADVRIIGSGTQFGISFNGYEAWANFPNEQLRFLNLIKKTKANGVLFITGDVHYGEISKIKHPGLYPIYDVTSSGLSSIWHFATSNSNRIEGPIMDNHFGLLSIDFSGSKPAVKTEIWDKNDNQRVEYTIPISEITFKN
tara:strand:- start:3181 stop:4230 length:1050 start_codon:yes stop_codon:yes gene_type:complete